MDIVLDTDMARPTKFDRLNLDMVREAATSLGSMEEIAALLKISPRTLLKARDAGLLDMSMRAGIIRHVDCTMMCPRVAV